MSSPGQPQVFISYRSASGLDEAKYFEKKFSERSIPVLRIPPGIQTPYPRNSIEEFDWFRENLDKATFAIPHILVIASEDAQNSLWVWREVLSSFAHARTLFIYWISGEDPRQWIAALPRFAYRLFPGSVAFLIDAREIVSANPVLRIAFPRLKTKICAAIIYAVYLFLAGLLFAIFDRVIPAVGFPAERTWQFVLEVLLALFCIVAVFPRRVVLAYKIRQEQLPTTRLVYAGQTGTGIVLLVASIIAILIVLVVASLHVSPTREHISWIGIIFLVVENAAIKLYKTLIGYPVSRMNANALTRAAHQTAQRIDAANRQASRT